MQLIYDKRLPRGFQRSTTVMDNIQSLHTVCTHVIPSFHSGVQINISVWKKEQDRTRFWHKCRPERWKQGHEIQENLNQTEGDREQTL